ncbi:TetR/AcrR family transcriptional regulator [Psychromonas algicola]|uniref:TetR/AcrR family transcriptional regulator n=1 Tax=Psychromonas algicola TaxID=2555642 RepID=UPI0010688790|nr:TetR/AcrR family transcriptional regulator [Psychromonas sp. RZ5]TEW52184.1 TetR/AcrR family transcriptional regulator [Psychromonas sp. RZ5]
MNKINQVGRPTENKGHRDKLLIAARKLFVEYDYDKVSLRMIAKKAQVDSALIGYYFQSKFGLFMEMLKETAAPVSVQLEKAERNITIDSPEILMRTYYQVMSDNPDFPKLMFKIASMPNTDKNASFKDILAQTLRFKNTNIFSSMYEQGLLKEGTDPLCAQMSFFSMMIFPFLMPESIKSAMGIEFNSDFITKLAEQNSKLLLHGCLLDSSTGENNNDQHK